MKLPLNSRSWRAFLLDESGPTATEYAVMLAFVLAVVVASLTLFGQSLGTKYADIKTTCFG
ncbi:MAG: Flp family type IVb pilin [Phycisphaerae bacterium]